ncbi:MAG TPA: site-specific integrase [Gillisia sp.]|nr:site-specific integrase [Gillisia sp.]
MRTSKTFSIHFWLNLAKKKGDMAPIYARVTVDGKRAEISLKRDISVTYWDAKSKRAKPRTPGAIMLNAYLDDAYANLLNCHKQLTAEFKLITAYNIKARFLGEDEQHKTLMELVDYHNKNMQSVLKSGTLKNYYTTEKYLKRFLKIKLKTNDISLKRLSYRFIIDFEQFLRNTPSINKVQPLNNNGVMKHLERFKKLFNLAMDLEWIEKNPISRFKLKFSKYEREFLSKLELQTLELGVLEQEAHIKTRDVFVFACYTGLSYIDVKLLTKNNIVKGIDGDYWVFGSREKTNKPVKIPLLNKALEIINKYDGALTDSLLPVYSNQKVNTYLKEIALELGIPKRLTFHSARHTFATTVTLSNGVPIETVSKLLGHSKLSTTQVYARVMEQKVSTDIRNLKAKLDTESLNLNQQKISAI